MYFSQGATDLDFERYLQPTVRCSMSPVQSPAAERFYLEAVDAEMESPVTQAEERPHDVLATPTGSLCPRYHITIKITINAHMWFIGGTRARGHSHFSFLHSCLSFSRNGVLTPDQSGELNLSFMN